MKKKIIGLYVCMLLMTTIVPLSGMASNENNPESVDYENDYLGSLINHPFLVNTPSDLYHTYDEMTILLQSLARNHSDIMVVTSIGKTYEGRELWIVKLSDNVNQEENEPEVLFMGAHHGNEKPSYEVLLFLYSIYCG